MAERFVFGLQPLLDQRRRLEAAKQQTFAAAKRACDEGSRELDRLDDAVRESGLGLHARVLSGPAPAACAELRFYDERLRFLARAIAARRERLTRSCDEVARAQAELLAAHRERMVVEKLRERRRKDFEAAQARRDEMEIDEANAQLWERRRRSAMTSRAET